MLVQQVQAMVPETGRRVPTHFGQYVFAYRIGSLPINLRSIPICPA